MGERIDFQEEARWEHPAIVRHSGDATMEMPSLRVRLHLAARNVPGLGYQTLLIEPADVPSSPELSFISRENCMENEFLKVVINRDGTLDVTDKVTQHTLCGLHYFSDNGEAGHAWRHVPPCHDRVITI